LQFFDLLGLIALSIGLCWRGLGVTLSGLVFVTSLIFTITPWCAAQKFLNTTEWGPAEVFQIGPRTI